VVLVHLHQRTAEDDDPGRVRQGVPGVQGQVDEGLAQLLGIRLDLAGIGLQVDADLDAPGESLTHQLDDALEDLRGVTGFLPAHVPPAEGQKLAGQVQSSPGCTLHLAQQHPGRGVLGIQDQQVGQPQDRRAHVVELVGQFARQLREGLDPLGPVGVFLALPAAGHVLHDGIDRPSSVDGVAVDQHFQQQAIGHRDQAAPGAGTLADGPGRPGQGLDQGGHVAIRRDGFAALALKPQDAGGFSVWKEASVGFNPDCAEWDLRAVAGKGVAHGGGAFVENRRLPFPNAGICWIRPGDGPCPEGDRSPSQKSGACCGRASNPSCE